MDRAGARLLIDVGAVIANWRLVADKVGPKAQAAAVVKADAYGLGADVLAPALAEAGCKRFFVATLDEAMALRPLLAEAEIFVLSGPLPGTEGDYPFHGLIPVLNSTEQIGRWVAQAERVGRSAPAAIHVDTGMSRLGLTLAEARALAEEPSRLAATGAVLVMTHLACADEAGHPLTPLQRDRFALARRYLAGLPGSLSASSGIFLGPDYHADWVRPGVALYGGNPTPGQPNPMGQVIRLQGKILQVRDVDAGDTVGYGATHRCQEASRIAVVAAGYADGLFRSLGNRGAGTIGSWRAPLVGRISMDLVTFDVTGIPESAAHPGATVELIGPGQDIEALAREAGTISYEILTALGARYLRLYGARP